MRRSNYSVVEETGNYLLIKDLGPWETYLTITNDAENVVEELASRLGSRKLYYIDSSGDIDELLVFEGRFGGFKPGPARNLLK